ncbi:stage II sporulation protein E [Anaerosporobacter sp.]|uniref:stage II sporulation protein E n=1 Tax=Anaerosporobacter sp. TaxID=1872529 RepID=UPI00286EC57D|nr:stage II sporulation protein E [Anaerosporobacter sp.]
MPSERVYCHKVFHKLDTNLTNISYNSFYNFGLTAKLRKRKCKCMKGITKRGIAITLIGILVSRAQFLSMDPIAVAYFAAAYVEKTTRPFLLIGVIFGSATVLPMVEAIKYTFVIILLTIIGNLIENRNKNKSIPLPVFSVIAALVTAGISISKYLLNYSTKEQLFYIALEAVLIICLTLVFSRPIKFLLYGELGQAMDNEQLISMSLLAGLVIYGMPDIGGIEFSLFKTTIFFLILLMGYKYGSGAGAVSGVVCGIVMGLQDYMREDLLPIVALMCCLGIVVGMFREVGRFATAIAYVVSIVGASYLYEEFLMTTTQIGAIVSSVILFLFLPSSMMRRIQGRTERKSDMQFVEQNIQHMTRQKLHGFAESFQKLSGTFHTLSDRRTSLSRQEVDTIFDELSDRLCKDCSNCNTCWKNDFYDTYKATFTILNSVEQNGYICEADVPVAFANRCINLNEFLAETNRSLEIAKVNLNWTNRMAESREAIAGQLGEVAKIIDEFSNDLSDTIAVNSNEEQQIINQLKLNHIQVKQISIMERRNKRQDIYVVARTSKGRCITTKETAIIIGNAIGKKVKPNEGSKNIIAKDYENYVFVEDTAFKTLTGVAKVPRVGESVSGDNFSIMNLDTGDMIMTLSDGMGSGKLACEESESVVELLEQLIDAGFKEESAIKLINSILVSRAESQMFSTVDMSILNLYTGICDFIKIGASTTFIKRDNWVESICSTTLPVGMFSNVDFDGVSKKLYDGDFIVMVTDGVLDCIGVEDKEGELGNIIMSVKSRNPQDIAQQILARAMEYSDNQAIDDMTVLVAGVWKKY